MGTGDTPDNTALRARLSALTALPLLPATVDALLRQDGGPAMDAVAGCARRDPALFAWLLKRHNALDAPEALASHLHAQRVLDELAPPFAAQVIADAPSFDGGNGDAYAAVVWPRAIHTACLAEALACLVGSPGERGESGYGLGLLLDAGAAALYRLDPAAYGPILREHAADLPGLLDAERARFGMTHSLAGRIVAEAWELPNEARRHVWLQYQPHPAPAGSDRERALSLILHWARRFGWNLHGGHFDEPARSLSVTPDALREAVEAAGDRADALVQSAPAQPAEPEAFRARLSAFIASASRAAPPEELEWAEQALMAGEAESTPPAFNPPFPAPPQAEAAAPMARALRAPIERITAHANALLTGSGHADPALLRAIYEQGQVAERVLQDVLAVTQPTAPKPEPLLLNYFLQQFFKGIEERLRARGVRVQLELAEGLPRMPLDRAAFEQVLLNLVTNAVQAMGRLGGVLSVSTASADAGVVVRLADTGPGLEPGIAAQAFEPFVKGANSGDGPGLGLTAARMLIEAHGGSLALEPGPEHGAVCTLRLAATVDAMPTPEAPTRPVKQPAPETPSRERPILQVVDVQSRPPESRPVDFEAPEFDPPVTERSQPKSEPPKTNPAASVTGEPDPKRLLMADPDFELGELLQDLLGRRGFEVVYYRDPAQALAQAASGEPFGQLLVDASLQAPDGRPLVLALHDALPGARVILTESPGAPAPESVEGVSTMRISKPFPVRALLSALQPAGSAGGR